METTEIITTTTTDLAYSQDKATIDVQVSTAKMYPRNIKRSTDNAIAIATMDSETAATCTYSVPRGGKAITGPSVHLAKIIAQVWGNMRIEARVISTDATNVTCQAIAFDLESNVAIKTEVKRSIVQNEYVAGKKTGRTVRMSEDMIVVTGNAGNSIALRNAIFAVIPKAVTDRVYKEAMRTITGDVSDTAKLLKKRKQVLDGLMNAYKVTEEEILSAIGKASAEHIGSDELVVLIGIGTAIKDGDTTVDEAFRKKSTSKPEPKSKKEVELETMIALINDSKTIEDLSPFFDDNAPEEIKSAYNKKIDQLSVINTK
jgi:hypothetical protein